MGRFITDPYTVYNYARGPIPSVEAEPESLPQVVPSHGIVARRTKVFMVS